MRIEELADVATATLATGSRRREEQHEAVYADLPIELLLKGSGVRSQVRHTRRRLDGPAPRNQQDSDEEPRRQRLKPQTPLTSASPTMSMRRLRVSWRKR